MITPTLGRGRDRRTSSGSIASLAIGAPASADSAIAIGILPFITTPRHTTRLRRRWGYGRSNGASGRWAEHPREAVRCRGRGPTREPHPRRARADLARRRGDPGVAASVGTSLFRAARSRCGARRRDVGPRACKAEVSDRAGPASARARPTDGLRARRQDAADRRFCRARRTRGRGTRALSIEAAARGGGHVRSREEASAAAISEADRRGHVAQWRCGARHHPHDPSPVSDPDLDRRCRGARAERAGATRERGSRWSSEPAWMSSSSAAVVGR